MSVKYAHKVKIYKLHRRGAWTWNHRGNHKQFRCTGREYLSHRGSAYGGLYHTHTAALQAALLHARWCTCEGK